TPSMLKAAWRLHLSASHTFT
ncbi:amidohydrolase family protein, partial [Vibrio parahaemolyticus V-223/04]